MSRQQGTLGLITPMIGRTNIRRIYTGAWLAIVAQLARPAKQRQSPCRHLRCQAADTPEPVSAESLPSAVLAVADLAGGEDDT